MASERTEVAGGKAAADYRVEAVRILDRISATQAGPLEQAAVLIADTVDRGGIVYAFGAGHSQSVALEFYYRAGGLAPCDVIEERTFGRAERLSGYAAVLLEPYPLGANDVLVVASNSGRNPLPVEMAIEARRRGARVVGITSLAHSRTVAPRPPLSHRLFEVCDVVIDNCTPPGDAAVELREVGNVRVGGLSTLAGVFITQTLVCRAAELIAARGHAVPVFCSMNVDGGDERNRALLDGVKGRVRGI